MKKIFFLIVLILMIIAVVFVVGKAFKATYATQVNQHIITTIEHDKLGNDAFDLSARFTYGDNSARIYDGPGGEIKGGKLDKWDVGTPGKNPPYYYWKDKEGHTNITFWANVKFKDGKCLYPRAIGYWNGKVGGYDGANGSGKCNF